MWKRLSSSYRSTPLAYWLGLPAVVCLVLALVLLFRGPHLNAEDFAKIKTGMTTKQISMMIGPPDEQMSQGALNLTGTTYIYHHGKSDVKLVFLNDKLIAKEGQF